MLILLSTCRPQHLQIAFIRKFMYFQEKAWSSARFSYHFKCSSTTSWVLLPTDQTQNIYRNMREQNPPPSTFCPWALDKSVNYSLSTNQG